MASNRKPQSVKQIFSQQSNGAVVEAFNASVRQDKGWISSARTGMPQPAPHQKPLRPHSLNTATARSKNKPKPKRKTVHLTIWIDPIVKRELQRLAEQEGLTVSKTGSAFLEQALQNNIDMHYSALLEPIIRHEIHKQMQGISNRLAWLLVRIAFDAEQTRAIVTNILGRQQGITEETLKNILAMSQRTAKGNITRTSPELRELINAVENWLLSKDEEQEPSN
jgi:hypothetical protein